MFGQKLNIKNLKELENVAIDIKDAAREYREGFVFQRVEGRGEFVAGLFFTDYSLQ